MTLGRSGVLASGALWMSLGQGEQVSAWCRAASDSVFPGLIQQAEWGHVTVLPGPHISEWAFSLPCSLGPCYMESEGPPVLCYIPSVSPLPSQIQTQCLSFCLISLEIPKDTVYLLPLFSLPCGQRVEIPPTAFCHLRSTPPSFLPSLLPPKR